MTNEKQHRIGLIGAISFVIGNSIGSGLFITPTAILQQTNSVGAALSIWLLSAVISVMGACSYIELGTSIRKSGSDFAYLCHVKWFSLAFSFMTTGCFLLYPGILTIQSQTFAQYFFEGCRIKIENPIHDYWIKTTVSFSLMIFLMFLNMFSVKTIVARFQIATTIAKIGSTFLIIAIGFYYLIVNGKVENLHDLFRGSTITPLSISSAFFAGLFAYSGWDILCMGVSDIENPKRTLRLAVLIGMFVVSVVTIATNFSFFVVLSIPEILNSEAVATTFAQKTLGQAQYLMPFLICILLVGSINSTIYVGSRFLFSGACTNQLPSFLAISNKKHNSPRAAVFYHVVIGMLLTFTGNAVTLINSLSYVIWLQRAMSMVVILYIRFKNIPVHPGRVKMPLLLHFSFLLIILALVFTNGIQDPKAAVMGVGFLIVCLLIYFALVWDRALPRFDCYHHYSHLIGDKLTTMNGWLFDGIVDKTSDEAEEPINKE